MCNFSLPYKKNFQFWNWNELFNAILFTYVIFAAMWLGPYYVIAVEYDSYAILQHCVIPSNERKYVPRECLTIVDKVNYKMRSAYFRKMIISFVVAVRPSVRPHRVTRPPVDGLSKKIIIWECLQNTWNRILACINLARIKVNVHTVKEHLWHLAGILLEK
jgi:hypothetical protein